VVNRHKLPAISHSILFVCSANQCRSPMAMVLFGKLVRDKRFGLEEWIIASAGCQAFSCLPATSTAQFIMQNRGLDLSRHRSQMVTQELFNDYSLILCMEKDQKAFFQNRYPTFSIRVYLLSEMDGQEEDI